MALTANRNTPKMDGNPLPETLELPAAASAKLFAGSIAACDASGNIVKGTAATALTCCGRTEALADNSSGAAGDIKVKVRPGVYYMANSGSDPVAAADRFATVFIEDDQTISKTSNGGTRSAAGLLVDVDSGGAWVLMSPYFRGAEDSGLPSVQAGTSTLVAGTKSISAGVTISATSRILVAMKDPGAGAITSMAALDVPAGNRVVGGPGVGAFTVNAIDDTKAVIATAVCTFDYLIIG